MPVGDLTGIEEQLYKAIQLLFRGRFRGKGKEERYTAAVERAFGRYRGEAAEILAELKEGPAGETMRKQVLAAGKAPKARVAKEVAEEAAEKVTKRDKGLLGRGKELLLGPEKEEPVSVLGERVKRRRKAYGRPPRRKRRMVKQAKLFPKGSMERALYESLAGEVGPAQVAGREAMLAQVLEEAGMKRPGLVRGAAAAGAAAKAAGTRLGPEVVKGMAAEAEPGMWAIIKEALGMRPETAAARTARGAVFGKGVGGMLKRAGRQAGTVGRFAGPILPIMMLIEAAMLGRGQMKARYDPEYQAAMAATRAPRTTEDFLREIQQREILAARQARLEQMNPAAFQILQQAVKADLALMASIIKDAKSLDRVFETCKAPREILMLVGPEGGFSSQEISQAIQEKISLVSLGPRRLRAETAGILLVGLVLFKLGELG